MTGVSFVVGQWGVPRLQGKTVLAYFGDTYLTSISAKVLSVEKAEGDDNLTAVCLDRTVAYPAGGGQPSDTGRIVGGDGSQVTFTIHDVKAVDGAVLHLGLFGEEGVQAFSPGAEVTVHVDADRRLLNARIHSAGHLLDVAMTNIGFGPRTMVPAKGMHAPEQAYVEYTGKVEGLDKEQMMADLKAEMNRLVGAGGASASDIMVGTWARGSSG